MPGSGGDAAGRMPGQAEQSSGQLRAPCPLGHGRCSERSWVGFATVSFTAWQRSAR